MMISPYPFGNESFVLVLYQEKTKASLFGVFQIETCSKWGRLDNVACIRVSRPC